MESEIYIRAVYAPEHEVRGIKCRVRVDEKISDVEVVDYDKMVDANDGYVGDNDEEKELNDAEIEIREG